ncbi:hypothetical protein [Pontibacter vulgaris]|uniref:hypothetical protein n=1 Tax=Pontibacter vulgaris TaxID=2905679 RepID=UPI001FA78D0C|nr:hypothetical protein [Pontibacter vulgaris]
MKKTLLFIFCFLPFISFAQENESFLIKAKVKQGSLMLGGTISAYAYQFTDELSNSSEIQKGNIIQAQMKAKNGYFVLHDLAVGLDISLNHVSKKITSDTEKELLPDRTTYLLAGPFVRYYLDNGIFGELTIQSGLLNLFPSGKKYNLMEGGLGVGYAFFFNEKFSIEPTLAVRYFQQKEDDRKNTTLGPVLGVGIQAYLLRKKAHVIKKAL